MRFIIITPTYKRPELLEKAINSVTAQTYENWHMIIVSDSSDASYESVEKKMINNNKITYVKNEDNRGANFSRNLALDIANEQKEKNDWIILLDDDDTFANDALETFVKINKKHPNEKWLLTNRAYYNGETITKIPKSDKHYSYIYGFLLTKKLKGDATHCISLDEIKKIRFPKYVKQGEEWLLFYELSLHIKKFFYHYHNCTLSDGYSPDGLNFRKRTKIEQFKSLCLLVKESYIRKIIWHPTLLAYICARIILIIFK